MLMLMLMLMLLLYYHDDSDKIPRLVLIVDIVVTVLNVVDHVNQSTIEGSKMMITMMMMITTMMMMMIMMMMTTCWKHQDWYSNSNSNTISTSRQKGTT